MPPNCVAFVAVVAFVAFVAVSADEAFALRIAYGVEVTCCRGVSNVNDPAPLGRALISRKRFAPLKLFAPKSSVTLNTPALARTLLSVCVDPICAPLVALSNNANCKS